VKILVCSVISITALCFISTKARSVSAAADGAKDPAPPSNTKLTKVTRETADYVLTDAKIYTADSARHMAEALAVRDGKIIFVGTAADAAKFSSKKTVVQRANGGLVLPGLVDAHIHPTRIVDFGACDLKSKKRTLAEISEFVKDCIERQKTPEREWVEVIH